MKNIAILISTLIAAIAVNAQVPVLSSLPSSQYVIYLDFDGEVVNNTNWSATTIDAASSGLTNAQIIEVFNRVAEKYRPFDVNITTSLSVYQAAAVSKRTRVVITTTSSWYGSAGGVAFIGAFGTPAYEPAWVFVNMLSYVPEYVADATAHEVGHTLWLNHHGKYDANCNRTSSYHPGQGSGQTGWGPIMGAPYGYNMVLWYKGATTSMTCSGSDQDDLAVIVANNGFTYRPDDHGNTIATATNLNIINNALSDSGIITTTADSDFFKLVLAQTSNVTLNTRPYSINQSTNAGANLHTALTLMNSSGTTITSQSPGTVLNATVTANNLAAGTYYIKVDGIGVSNYNDYGGTGPNDYGSLGRFYLTGTVTPNATPTIPTANFNMATSACAGETVSCTNTSTNNPTTFLWTCTGGTPTSASTTNASFTFNNAGTYTVKLKVSNASGTDSITKSITVNAKPTLSSNVTATAICINSSTSLTVSGANTYSWSPSTGLNTTTGSAATASPTSSITYTIVGTASNGCTANRTIALTVNQVPDVTGNNAAICSGASANLTMSGASTYTWSPAAGLSATTGASVMANPTITTTYSIIGTASTGCTTLKTVVATVSSNPTLTTSNNTSICSGASTTMTVSGASTYSWVPASALNNSTGTSVVSTATTSTTYTVTGINASGCSSSKTIAITVNPKPILTTSSNAAICSGSSTMMTVSGANTYTWAPNTSITSSTATSVVASPSSSITYTVTGTASTGCTNSTTVAVTVNAVPALSGSSNTSICSGASTSLNVSGANTYAWSPATGLSNSTGTLVTASPTASTTYTITGTSSAGCTAARTVAITVNATPTLTTSNNTGICSGSSTTLTVSGASTFVWSPATSLSSSTGIAVIAQPTSSTTYTVVGTSSNGCSIFKTITVTVNPGLNLTASAGSSSICSGASTSLTASGATTYSWSPATGLSSTTASSLTATPTNTTTYTVTGTASGCTTTQTIVLTVNPIPNISSTANSSICSGSSLLLSASGAATYAWSPNTALNTSTGSTVTASPTSSITYTINGTSAAGCTGSKTIAITVNSAPTLTSSNNTSICTGSSTSLFAGGATAYSWSPAAGLSSTTASTITANPTVTTTYTITGTTNGCSSQKTVSVTVNANPNVTVSSNSIGICSGTSTPINAYGATTYTWAPNTALSATTGSAISTTATTTTTYTVTGSSNGCSATKTITVFVSPNFTLSGSSGTAICSGNATTLSNSGATSYSWSPAAGLSNTTASIVTASPAASTTYTITGTSGYCVKTRTISVTVNSKPTITPAVSQPTCSGVSDGSISITASDAVAPYTYLWNNNATTSVRNNLSSGTYMVTVTSANTCSNSQNITLTNPQCGLPVSVAAQNISTSAAQITWGAQSCVVNYRLRYRLSSISIWTTVTFAATNTSYTISGLAANSTYQYQMQSYCNAANSDSSGYTPVYSFTTLSAGGCSTTPTSLTVNTITSTGAKLNWGIVSGAWGYKVRIRPSDNSAPFVEYTVQAPTTNYTVTGLSANTSYKWNLMTLCDASGSSGSNWSTTSYFSTLGSGRIEEVETFHNFDVQIFPNPTTGPLHFKFFCEADARIDAVLYSLIGQQVWSSQFIITTNDHNLNIDISALAQGVYLLVLRNEQDQISYKIIKH
jgi:PKD repeat protein